MRTKTWAIGVDIGGTKIAVGLIHRDGRIAALEHLPTSPRTGFKSGVERIRQAIDGLLADRRVKRNAVAGIGVGCAGPVDPRTGTIHNDFTLPTWAGCNLVRSLQQATCLSVRMENDADAALLGEAWVGAASGLSNVVMLTIGTGVGGAVLADGRLLRGVGGQHPEIGHLLVGRTGPSCYCGTRGCLESLVAGPALSAQARRGGWRDPKELFAQAGRGNLRARAIVACSASHLATAVQTIAHSFLPERIVLGGGIMQAHFLAWYRKPLTEALNALQMFPDHRVKVVRAALGNRAGVVGAASLAFNKPD